MDDLRPYIERSIRREHLILASGRETDFYIDLRAAVLEDADAMAFAGIALRRILPPEVESLGGVPTAGLMLMGAVLFVSHLGGTRFSGFYTRAQAKAHGTTRQVEGHPRGVACLIEDTVTTGGSIRQHAAIARAHGVDVRHAVALFDREEGGREALAADGITLHACYRPGDFGL